MATMLKIYANYVPAPLGGWLAVVWGDDETPRTVHGATPETVFDAVSTAVSDVADRRGSMCVTIHSLNGDPSAFVPFAREHQLGQRC